MFGNLLFWRNWDETRKAAAKKIIGLIVAAITVFTLIAIVTFFFHWKEDQSLLTDPSMMDPSVPVGNSAGKLGFRLGRFLVCRCFGLGSLALLVILAAVSTHLLSGKWRYSLLKTTAVALTGTMLISLTLAFFAKHLGLGNAFGGGLGGECGSFVINWSENLFGIPLTLFFVIILIFCWLFFSSERFAEKVSGLSRKATDKVFEVEEEEEEIPEPEPEPAPAPALAAKVAESAPVPPAAPVAPVVPAAPAGPAQAAPEGSFEIIRDDTALSTTVSEPLPRINIRDELPQYKFPTLEILDVHNAKRHEVSSDELVRNNNKIRVALNNYRIQVADVKAIVGPTVTLYKVYPAPGVRIAEIKKLQEDIALSLNAKGVRVVTLSDCVGIEVANDYPSTVPLRALLNDDSFRESKAELPVAIGYTITQKVKVFDLADAPHLLVAGATKQGKSVGLNVLVSSLLYSKHPSEMKMVFIDPKMVEFSAYGQLLKHYLAVLPDSADEKDEQNNAIVKKAKDAEKILRSLCIEMDNRYELLSKAYVNNIKLYNEKYKDRHLLPTEGHKFLPYLVVVIDEYADLTMSVGGSPENKASARSIQQSIIRLAQKGRAAGIHVILATQRPSVDVISGIIKTNFPTRIAFRVAARADSQTILDSPGAEKLIGKGDMLYYAGVEMERIQCGFVSNDEINRITKFIGDQQGYKKSYNTPYYLPSVAAEGEAEPGSIDMSSLDERFEEAARMVVMSQKGSTSDLQRRLGMGYAKAGRVMDQLEAAGIVGPQEGSKPRQVLVPDLDTLSEILRAFVK